MSFKSKKIFVYLDCDRKYLYMNPAILRNIKIAAMPTNAIFYGDHEVDSSTSIDDRVASIFNLFEKHGEMNYVGEDVSQLQHAQQVQTKF